MTDVGRQLIPTVPDMPPQIVALGLGDVFLPYQAEATALSHEHPLLVIEKSRRIGITWGFAGDDAVTAITNKADGGDDILYISYSFDMAREYIDAAAAFAKAFMGFTGQVGEYVFDDENPGRPGETRQIKAFRIDFASGNTIQALSSAPRSLRGKQGRVRIDEAAFVNDLAELLKAALALLIWGGQVTVMSTHNGVDHEFNQLIKRIQSGEQDGHVMKITFMDAIAAGLFERICLRKGEEPTEDGKAAFIKKIYGLYGAGASEELDVIPARGDGAWLTYDEIERAEDPSIPIVRWTFDDEFTFLSDEIRQLRTELWCRENLDPVLDALSPQSPHGIGGDFGRRHDLTCIWISEEDQRRDYKTRLLVELRRAPFTEQIFILTWIMRKIRRWSAQLDEGNFGVTIVERLQQIFGPTRVIGVNLRAAWWAVEGPPIKQRYQDGRGSIPRDRDVATDHRQIKLKNGVPSVPETRTQSKGEDAAKGDKRHADSAIASVLSWAALRSGAAEPFEAGVAGDRPRALSDGAELMVIEAGWGAAVNEDQGPAW